MTTVPMEPVAAPEPRWRALLGTNLADRLYRGVLTTLALLMPLLLLALVGELATSAWPAIQRFGLSFLWTSVWDPVAGIYGAAPMIFGTLASSLLALVIAVPLSLGVAIYLTEFAPKWLRQPVAFLVELLAAIPSVVYGLWGIFVLIPFLRTVVVPPLRAAFGWTPFLSGVFYGNSLLAGSVILAIMIVPYIAAVSREVLLAVPVSQREAALGMGATRWEAVWTAVVPYGRAGLIGAVILGLGRALGETMAVTMLIGNRHDIGLSVLQPAYTMAAAIANEFSEATTSIYLSALFEVGLILFVVTVAVNALARVLIWRVARGTAVGAGRCERASAAPPLGQRHHDRPGSRAVLGGGPRPGPDSRASRRERRVVSRLELFRQESGPGRAIGRRRGQRDRGNGDHRRPRRAHRPPGRDRHRPLSRRVRVGPPRLGRAVRGGCPERHPVDRGRHLRVDLAREADGPFLRARRERGARGAHGADAGPDHRGDGAARPPHAA